MESRQGEEGFKRLRSGHIRYTWKGGDSVENGIAVSAGRTKLCYVFGALDFSLIFCFQN